MRRRPSWVDYLEDILEAMGKVTEFVAGMDYQDFEKDDKTAYAVIRGIEIIGEATKRVPAEIRDQYQKCPGDRWRA